MLDSATGIETRYQLAPVLCSWLSALPLVGRVARPRRRLQAPRHQLRVVTIDDGLRGHRQAGRRAISVTVDSIVPSGVGPEDYEPRPDDVRRIADAELIVSNGVGLDDFLDKIITAAGHATAERLVLGDGIPTVTVDGEVNPHFWLDPTLVERYYLPAIRDRLAKLRPADAADFAAASDAYAGRSARARRRQHAADRHDPARRTASS